MLVHVGAHVLAQVSAHSPGRHVFASPTSDNPNNCATVRVGSDQFIEVTATGEPLPLEHDAVAWVPQSELLDYDLAPTDRAFAMHLLDHHA